MQKGPIDRIGRWPDFFLIGAAKAGSTALFKAIARHPRVFSTTEKQPAFFSHPNKCPDFKGPGGRIHGGRVVFDEQAYRTLFADCPIGHLAFEGSIYLSDAKAPLRISQSIPNAFFIAILRHPVERAFSQYLHNKSLGLEPCKSFEEAWKISQTRMNADWPPPYDYRNRGFYGLHLDRWMEHFSKEQILVLFYEDWRDRPKEILNRIWDHLGLDRIENPVITKENISSRQPRWAWLHHHMVAGNSPLRVMAQRLLPQRIRDGIVRSIASLNLTKGPQIDPALRSQLALTYREDLNRLEFITGRNLSMWKT
jgi:hypothetical protein